MKREQRQPAFEDTDKMPFGCHKDKPLQDVPVGYLHWLWCNGLNVESCSMPSGVLFDRAPGRLRVANYIWNSLDALKKDYPDGIWE